MSFGGPERERQIKTGDGHILTISESGAPHGWPVFLFHGTPGSRTGPRPRFQVLYRRGIRLISYDRPGYGGSTRREGRLVADAAKDVAAIVDHLEIDRFSVVGRSGGGPHALACAALLQERVHRTAALVSLAPRDPNFDWYAGMTKGNVDEYTAADKDAGLLADQLSSKASRIRRNPVILLEQLLEEMTDADRKVVRDMTIRRLLVNAYDEALKAGPYGWIDDVFAFRSAWGFDLTAITSPVRVWHGVKDNFAPASHSRWLAAHIPGAELQIQAETAHFGAVEILPTMLTWLAAGQEAPTDHAGLEPLERLGIDHPVQQVAIA